MTNDARLRSSRALDDAAMDQVSGGQKDDAPKPPPKEDKLPPIPNDPPKDPIPFPPIRPQPVPTDPPRPEPRVRWWW